MRIIGEVKVTPEVLCGQADEVENLVKEIRLEFDYIKSFMDKTKVYWIGYGGNNNRAYYDAQKKELEIIFKRLMEHPKDLRTMAGIYNKTEKEIVSNAKSLPIEVIS